jgi:hypothetical protein
MSSSEESSIPVIHNLSLTPPHFSQLSVVEGRFSWVAGYRIDIGYCCNIPALFKLCQNELSTARRDGEEYHISVHQIEACEWHDHSLDMSWRLPHVRPGSC